MQLPPDPCPVIRSLLHIDLSAHLQLPHGSLTPGSTHYSGLTSRLRDTPADEFSRRAGHLFLGFLLLFISFLGYYLLTYSR